MISHLLNAPLLMILSCDFKDVTVQPQLATPFIYVRPYLQLFTGSSFKWR